VPDGDKRRGNRGFQVGLKTRKSPTTLTNSGNEQGVRVLHRVREEGEKEEVKLVSSQVLHREKPLDDMANFGDKTKLQGKCLSRW